MCSQYVVNGNADEISKANTMMQAALSWWSVCLDLIMGNTQLTRESMVTGCGEVRKKGRLLGLM